MQYANVRTLPLSTLIESVNSTQKINFHQALNHSQKKPLQKFTTTRHTTQCAEVLEASQSLLNVSARSSRFRLKVADLCDLSRVSNSLSRASNIKSNCEVFFSFLGTETRFQRRQASSDFELLNLLICLHKQFCSVCKLGDFFA